MKYLLIIALSFTATYAAAQADSARHYFDQGMIAKQERRWLVAEKQFTKSLEFDKNNTSARLNMADAQLEMKKLSQARAQYMEVLKTEPNNPQALEKAADLAFMMHAWADAVTYGKQAIDRKVGKSMHFKVAKALYEQEDYVEASKYLKTASEAEPKNAEVPYMMANIWVEMNNGKRAIEMYEIALALDTNNANWHYEFALICQQLDDHKRTIEHLEKAIAKGYTTNLDVYTTLGNAYMANKQFDKGMTYLQKVLDKKPMDKVLYNDIAYAYYNAAKYDEAIEWWDKILTLDKQNAKSLFMIGVAFQKKGQKEKGQRLCDEAIKLDPTLASYKKEKLDQSMGL